jgi:hypothetical protein
MVRSFSPTPAADNGLPVAQMSAKEKLERAIHYSYPHLKPDARAKLTAFLTPEALEIMAVVLAGWIAAHAFGAGEVADGIVFVGGWLLLGWDAVHGMEDLVEFAQTALGATTDAELRTAGRYFASAVVTLSLDVVLGILTHKAGKALKVRDEPTITGDSSLPPGAGETDKFGNITYSTAGTAEEQALALNHEKVHAFLSPKLKLFRNFRAEYSMSAYQRSAFLRYVEEALAESYAQLKVNGVKGLPSGITFPIRNGYVTLSAVVKEGAIGTVTVGGVTYYVSLKLSR